jgi:hypothetical protein
MNDRPDHGFEPTLVINTSQQKTYDLFEEDIEGLAAGELRIYDTAGIRPSSTTVEKIEPNPMSYLAAMRREKADSIIVTYDKTRTQGFYLGLLIFMLIAHILGKNVSYYTKDRNYVALSSVVPGGFPLSPLYLIRNARGTVSAFIRCLFSRPDSGRVMGFNKNYAPHTFWYETLGKKQMQIGCWGYSFLGNFGESQKERFFTHYLSYGYLLIKLGFRKFHAVSSVLYLAAAIIVFMHSGKWIMGAILLPLLLISPYFTFSFLVYTKPENIGWFLALPALYCASAGYTALLAVILLIMSFLSISVLFLIVVSVFAMSLSGGNYAVLVSLIPAGIKLFVDFYPVISQGFMHELLHAISGKGGEKRSASYRKYGLEYIPFRYYVLLGLALALMIAELILSAAAWPVTAIFIILLAANFLLVRMADPHTFYRFFVTVLLFGLLSTDNIYFLVVGGIFLLVNPSWLDDYDFMNDMREGKPYPPMEHVVWTNEQDRALEGFLEVAAPGSRVLFEYTGHLIWSPFRNIMAVLEAKLYDRNVDLLPHEFTFYTNPHFSFDLSSALSPEGDLGALSDLLESTSISYLMVFSKELAGRLEERGYRALSEYELPGMRGFIYDHRIPAEKLYLFHTGTDRNYCSDDSVTLERSPNRMTLRGTEADREYTIHYNYHKDWSARQGTKQLRIEPVESCGLEFMKVATETSEDIRFTFGSINHILR